MGILFRRQSDRKLPRTDFSKGIRKGKLMAHEMTGVILVLLTVLRSTEGRNACLDKASKAAKEHIGTPDGIANWIYLLENCLTWEAWLSQATLPIVEVVRFRTKVRDLLWIEQDVGKRTTGMGYRTFNFHAARHVYSDIINFGVPKWVNTMSDEMHHKQSKNAALTTQRRPQEFDYQVGMRCHESDCVNLASLELTTGRATWLYGKQPAFDIPSPKKVTALGGVQVGISYDKATESIRKPTVISRMKDKAKFCVEPEVLAFLKETVIQDYFDRDLAFFHLYTEHRRIDSDGEEILFRGSPFFLGKPWRDWCTIYWGGGDEFPAQIYWFLDLRDDHVHGLEDHKPYKQSEGIYALVESAALDPLTKKNESLFANMSDLTVSYIKEFQKTANGNIKYDSKTKLPKKQFYLVPVDSILDTACMVADVGNPNKGSYLKILPQKEWAHMFGRWLRQPHLPEPGAQSENDDQSESDDRTPRDGVDISAAALSGIDLGNVAVDDDDGGGGGYVYNQANSI